MPRKNIHPVYNDISVVLTDGTEFKTKSCSKNKVIKLDVDPLNHPAWKAEGDRFVNLKDDQVSRFNKKFGNFHFGVKKTVQEAKAEDAEKQE
jgi:large subunit ribosomal protein L31